MPSDAQLLVEPALYAIADDDVASTSAAALVSDDDTTTTASLPMRRIATCNMALQSHRVLLLDAGSVVLVWFVFICF